MEGIRIIATAIAVSMVGCYGLQPYACSDNSNCDDGVRRGVCEDSGFCGYDDTKCDSGRRYDDLAGGGLAGRCVEEGATSTGETSTGETSTGEALTGEALTGDPTCVDEDADGFGVGAACLGEDCDDDNPAATDDCIYMAPDGDDGAAGTADAPWQTFDHVVPELSPGSSLVLLPGIYERAVHGPLVANCDTGAAVRGTAGAPVFIRAAVERTAHIKAGVEGAGVRITGCDHWRLRGIQVSGEEGPTASSSPVLIVDGGEQVVLRRMLVHTNNPYVPTHLYWLPGTANALVEECEAYNFSASGFRAGFSTNTTFRRVYAHSRDRADHPDCVVEPPGDEPPCTVYSGIGDDGIQLGLGATVENAIFERTEFGINGRGDDASVIGSAFVDGRVGVIFGPGVGGVAMQDLAGANMEGPLVWLRGVESAEIRNVTSVSGGVLRTDLGELESCPTCTTTITNALGIGAAGTGVSIQDNNAGAMRYSNVFGSAEFDYSPTDDPIDDDVGYFQRSTSVAAPRMGTDASQCIAYVPRDSDTAGAGENPGEDIGANIVYRTVGRALTDEPLWDPQTGEFPCGAIIEGVNDDPATSCIGVHRRLNVATNGCPLPR